MIHSKIFRTLSGPKQKPYLITVSNPNSMILWALYNQKRPATKKAVLSSSHPKPLTTQLAHWDARTTLDRNQKEWQKILFQKFWFRKSIMLLLNSTPHHICHTTVAHAYVKNYIPLPLHQTILLHLCQTTNFALQYQLQSIPINSDSELIATIPIIPSSIFQRKKLRIQLKIMTGFKSTISKSVKQLCINQHNTFKKIRLILDSTL